MSLAFSRSMRSLRLDGFRATRIGLALAIVNMLALVAWFFLAQVTLYETSPKVAWGEQGMIAATFPKEALGRLRQGQAAIVRLNLGGEQPVQVLTAYLYRLPQAESGAADSGQVLFYLTGEGLADSLRPPGQGGVSGQASSTPLSGQVEVEVEYITPAQLVLRSSGKYLNQVPVSPGDTERTP